MEMQTLVRIQESDLETDDLNARAEAIPRESAALDAELADAKDSLSKAKERLKELEKQQRHEELILEDKNTLLKKYDTQLFALKTNKEHKAMLAEIDTVKAEISSTEERILEILTDLDYATEERASAEKALQDEEALVRDKKLQLEKELEEVKRNLTEREQLKQELIPRVDEDLYHLYERVRRAKKNGPGAVPVVNDSCGGCFMQIPAQVVNEVMAGDRIITCQSCSRILYWEENVRQI
jgi:predicted  nucleic acid-binding Zn-ribbon protein